MELKIVKIENPDSLNMILGQSHFIKSPDLIFLKRFGGASKRPGTWAFTPLS